MKSSRVNKFFLRLDWQIARLKILTGVVALGAAAAILMLSRKTKIPTRD